MDDFSFYALIACFAVGVPAVSFSLYWIWNQLFTIPEKKMELSPELTTEITEKAIDRRRVQRPAPRVIVQKSKPVKEIPFSDPLMGEDSSIRTVTEELSAEEIELLTKQSNVVSLNDRKSKKKNTSKGRVALISAPKDWQSSGKTVEEITALARPILRATLWSDQPVPNQVYIQFDREASRWRLVRLDPMQEKQHVAELCPGSILNADKLGVGDDRQKFKLRLDGNWESTEEDEVFVLWIHGPDDSGYEIRIAC